MVEDQKEDDQSVAEPHPTYFRELGYPGLEELMQHPVESSDSVQNFFHRELLGACLAADPEMIRWVVNSIDRVRVENGRVIVEGQAYRKG
jgi:hypothetical protein